ncbi:MAG: lactate utilization protein [Pirellulales bacterium]
MGREEFLARVRQAAETGKAYRVALRPVPDDVAYVGVSGDPVAALAREVQEVGGEAAIAATPDEAQAILHRWLDRAAPRSVLGWRHPVLERLGVPELVRRRGASWWDADQERPSDLREHWLAADVGLTGVEWAIAETGSLVMASRPGRERVVSLLPPVHIAIVEESRILPDLLDLFRRLQADGLEQLPSNLVLITGPSKTGDIELQLTTGVHGPGQWLVLILRD